MYFQGFRESDRRNESIIRLCRGDVAATESSLVAPKVNVDPSYDRRNDFLVQVGGGDVIPDLEPRAPRLNQMLQKAPFAETSRLPGGIPTPRLTLIADN